MPANSANPATGTLQTILAGTGVSPKDLQTMVCECARDTPHKKIYSGNKEFVNCCIQGINAQKCVANKIDKAQAGQPAGSPQIHTPAGGRYSSAKLPGGKGYCLPDMVVGCGPKPVSSATMQGIIELKTPCTPGQKPPNTLPATYDARKVMGKTMRRCYENAHLPREKGPKPGGNTVKAIGASQEACS